MNTTNIANHFLAGARRRNALNRLVLTSKSTGLTEDVIRLLERRRDRLPLTRPSGYAGSEAQWIVDMWNSIDRLTTFIQPYESRVHAAKNVSNPEYVRAARAHVYAVLELASSLTIERPSAVWAIALEEPLWPADTALPTTPGEMRVGARNDAVRPFGSFDPTYDDDRVPLSVELAGEHIATLNLGFSDEYRRAEYVEYHRVVVGDGIDQFDDWISVPKEDRFRSDFCEIFDGVSNIELPIEDDLDYWNDAMDYLQDTAGSGGRDETWPRALVVEACTIDFNVDIDPEYGRRSAGDARLTVVVVPALVDDALVLRRAVMPWFRERVEFYYKVFSK